MQKYLLLAAVMLGHAGFSLAGIERQIKQAIKRSEVSEVKQLVASRQGRELSLFELKKLADVAVDSVIERSFMTRKKIEVWWMTSALTSLISSSQTLFFSKPLALIAQLRKGTDGLSSQELEQLRKNFSALSWTAIMALLNAYFIYENYCGPKERLSQAEAIRDLLKAEVVKREKASSQKGSVLGV